MQLFPEIKKFYGNDVFLELEITLSSTSPSFISINTTTGIEIGKNAPASLQLLVFCTNATQPKELAV